MSAVGAAVGPLKPALPFYQPRHGRASALKHTTALSGCLKPHATSAALPRRSLQRGGALAATSSRPGGGSVLDRPALVITTPDRAVQKQIPPQYKLLLHNDDVNKRDYVVKVLLKVVEGLTLDRASDIMQEADAYGVALVIVAPQEDAENMCNGLRNNGLVATVEPERGGGAGGAKGGGEDKS